tara:strand:- start:21472 stop:22449 length:978 start_codon:yes stop_codon:yes gene_type:complete
MRLWTDEIESHRDEARSVLGLIREAPKPFQVDPAGDLFAQAGNARKLFAERSSQAALEPSQLARESVIEGPGGALRLRVFLPEGAARGLFLHIHGGGWILGGPEMGDPQNEALARKHGLVAVSVDYRLAPENPYPAAADDCEAAAVWLLSEGAKEFGAERVFIGGESSGAHLALVTANRIRERHGLADRVHGLNLVFGIYDLNGTPSQRDNGGREDLLDPQGIRMFIEAFTPGMSEEQRRDPDISPLNADLSGLPPSLISVGVNDHFRDDSLFLAARLLAEEQPVELAVFPDSPHGFTNLPSKMATAFQKRLDGWWAERLMGDGS